MEPSSRPELYKWQRITSKSRQTPTKPKVEAVTNDIQQWIKKVEKASDFAAAQAFGKARAGNSTKSSILHTVDQLHDHDAAYEEAQQLVNDWVSGQLHNINDHSTEDAIWSDEENTDNNFEPSIQNIIAQQDAGALSMEEYDRLMNIENYSEDLMTENVMDKLRSKVVVKPEFLMDLGDIGGKPTHVPQRKDPALKMQIRQRKVVERKADRRADLQKKREQDAARIEAVNAAKQKAAEERRKAANKSKLEEIEIQREMTRIKKELQEQRKEQLRKQEEERELEKRIAQVARSQAIAKQRKVEEDNDVQTARSQASDLSNDRKRKLVKAMEVAETRFYSHNLKLMRRCFNSWFDIVLERRLQLGKARAVSDWKALFRAWNAWRHFSRERMLDRMRHEHESSIIEGHRKLHQSTTHYETRILKKYFLQWQIWLTQQRQAKELEQDQKSVRDKMSAFLETGKKKALEQKQKREEEERMSARLSSSTVDDMFNERKKKISNNLPKRDRRIPTEAWQVTRKHLKLTNKQINDMTDTPQDETPPTDAFEEAIAEIQTVRSDPAVPKSFQNRFQAQQRILQEQQKALKDQKKMIEDLKFKQDKSLLEQQVKQQQVIQEQLDRLTKLTLQDRALNNALPKQAGTGRHENTCEESGVTVPQTARSGVSAASKVSKTSSAFSKKMEERAAERARAKQEREERKQQQEQIKMAEMLAKEEETREQEAELRKQRVEAFKEKRRLEKQRELELQQMKEKSLENQRHADEHSELRVMKFYGFNQLKQHHLKMKSMTQKAEGRKVISLLQQSFSLWKLRYETNEAIRNEKADDLHHKHLVKRCFKNWTQWKQQTEILAEKADRHYQSRLVSDIFRAWLDITTREKIEMWEKERHARQHDVLRIKMWVFSTWKKLPEERRQEIERERRREEMRRKVSNMLPDFRS